MLSRSEPQPLAGLVDYQDGSIVSRTLIGKRAGTVTLFAFDHGESLSEHTAPYDALVLVTDGEMEITIADSKHNLSSGDMLLLPASVPHAVFADSPSKMLLIMIRE